MYCDWLVIPFQLPFMTLDTEMSGVNEDSRILDNVSINVSTRMTDINYVYCDIVIFMTGSLLSFIFFQIDNTNVLLVVILHFEVLNYLTSCSCWLLVLV